MARAPGEITIYKRKLADGVGYQVYFTYYDDDGAKQTFRKSAPRGHTKVQAEQLGRRWRDELVQGRRAGVIDTAPSPTLADFYQRYLDEHVAVHLSRSMLKTRTSVGKTKLIPLLGERRMTHIGLSQVNQLIASMQKAGHKPGYINQALSALSQCFVYAVDTKTIPESAVPKIPRVSLGVRDRKEVLTREQVETLVGALEGQDRNFMRVMARTGLRRGECVGLRFTDIDWKKNVLRVSRSIEHDKDKSENAPKSQQARIVPLHADVKAALREQQKAVTGDICFPDARDHDEYMSPGQRNRLLDRAREKSGIGRLTYHLLRHTAASRMVNSGGNLRAVQEILGHYDITVTARYLHVDATHMQAAIDLL